MNIIKVASAPPDACFALPQVETGTRSKYVMPLYIEAALLSCVKTNPKQITNEIVATITVIFLIFVAPFTMI